MCGRYSLTSPLESVRQTFGATGGGNLAPRYNIAPTQLAAVVRPGEAGREIAILRWGLVPPWAKSLDIAHKTINARGETVAEKPAFRAAYRSRRCLVAADGFYEWRTENGAKQPYRITFADGRPFAFAGIWECWRPAADEPLETFAILTTEASEALRPIHHRMPVILPPDVYAPWLAGEAGGEVLVANADPALTAFKVDRRVNNVRFDDPECLPPLAEEVEALKPPEQMRLL